MAGFNSGPFNSGPFNSGGLATKNPIAKIFSTLTKLSIGGVFRTDDPNGLLAPAAPLSLSDFIATTISESRIDLAWTNNDAANTDNIIIQWTAGGIAQTDIMLDGSATSHSLTILEADTYHTFTMFAQNTTDNSNPVTGNATTDAIQAPATPTLSVSTISSSTLRLTIGSVANEDNIHVRYSANGTSGWSTPIDLAADTTAYNDSTLSAEQTRHYQVAASSTLGGQPVWSSAVSGTTNAASGSQPVPIPTAWLMYGDSQTAGRAVETEALSHVVAFTRIYDDTIAGSNIPGFSSRSSLLTDGFSGRSLEGHEAAFNSDKPLADPAWMHFQESGDQNDNGQTTSTEFGQTFEDFVNNIATEIGGAGTIISTETAFSFGREAVPYRNWDSYNTEQASRIATLAGQGITVYVADVDANIKALQTELTPGDVWYQAGETNNYHFTGIGNIMIALTMFDMLGYDVDELVTTGFTTTGEITQDRIATCKSIIKGRVGDAFLVTGPIAEGSTVTLSSSGFGNFDGEIVTWDDFEDQVLGNTIQGSAAKIGGNFTAQYGYTGQGLVWDDTHTHSGGKAAHMDWSIDAHTIRAFGWAGRGPYNKLFISYWRYMEGNYNRDADPADNHKQFYLFGNDTSAGHQMPQLMPMMPAGSNSWGLYQNYSDASISWSERHNINDPGWNYQNTDDQFQRWDVWVELNTVVDTYAGVAKVWLDGVLGIDNESFNARQVDGEFVDFRLGHMAQGFTSSAKAWFDDLYVATTQARVELSDEPTWGEAGIKEIQIVDVLNWTDSIIEVQLRAGGFASLSGKYLYVIKSDGTPYNTDGVLI